MIRHIALAAATAAATLMLASPASAQAAYYVATPAATPTKASFVTHSTPWALQNGAYVAQKAPERDAILCELVARSTGKLSGFSAGGKAYDAAQLDKCNAKAK